MHQIKLIFFYLYNKFYPQIREKKIKEKDLYKKKLGFNKEFTSSIKTSASDWHQLFINANIRTNDTVFLKVTYSCANTFEGGLIAFIDFLKDYFGKEGNIVLTAYTFDKSPLMYLADNPIFDVEKSHGKLSLFNEVFRRSEGVLRSIHPTHSICAFGKNASYIVKDHEIDQFCFHDESPIAKLYKMKAKEICIGVNPVSISNHYIEQFFTSSKYGYRDLRQPIMCRLRINNEIIYKKFQVMDQFRSISDNYDVFKGTKAEPKKYSIGEIDVYVQNLNLGLKALKDLMENQVYWFKVNSFFKDIFMKIVVKNIALKMFFNTKNATLYPIDRRE
jgi:aminoglycoside 3-N-acetyltransferase